MLFSARGSPGPVGSHGVTVMPITVTVQVSVLEAITVRLAGYIRVSTGGQLDGFGLEDQEQIVRRGG